MEKEIEEIEEIPQPIVELTKNVFGKKNYTIDDWDMDRVYITSGENEYTIRMWDIDDRIRTIRWTLFLDVQHDDGGGHGVECKFGNFKYKVS